MEKNKPKPNQLKMGVALSYTSMIIGYVILILYTPIMLKLLGKSEYGLYNLASSIISYLGLLSFGFGSSYVRFYSIYKVDNDQKNIAKLNGMFLIVFSIISIISIISGGILVSNVHFIFGSNFSSGELFTSKILMAVLTFNIAISFPLSVFNSFISANEQYIFQRIINILKTVINPFLMLPVLLLGYKSVGMVVVTTVITILVGAINVIFCIKKLHMKFLFNKFDFKLMKEIAIFSSYLFLNIIVDQINWNVDKFIIGRFRGAASVAVYGLAAQLNTYYITISSTISGVFIPRINKMVAGKNDNQALTELFVRVGRIQFIILFLIETGIIFFGKSFINFWVGSEYSEAYLILVVLIVSETVPLIQNLGIEIQKAKNMHKFRSVLYFFIAIFNVFISIPLAKHYGGIGAAIGTAIAQIIGNNLIMNIYYHKKIGINIKFFWIQILKFTPALILPIVSGVLIYMYIDLSKIIIFLVSGLFYVSIYFISMWLFGMNISEKRLVSEPLSKITKFRKKLR